MIFKESLVEKNSFLLNNTKSECIFNVKDVHSASGVFFIRKKNEMGVRVHASSTRVIA